MQIKQIKSYIKNSSLFNLGMGTMISQLILIIVSPITTRIYSPDDLGEYTLLLTIVTLFGPVICGKFDSLIVSENDETNVNLAIITSTTVTILFTFLTVTLFYFYINHKIKDFSLANLILISILLLLTGFTNIAMAYSNRLAKFKVIAKVSVIRTSIQNIFLVLFGFLKYGSTGMLLSQLLGNISGFRSLLKGINFNFFRNIKIKSVKSYFSKNTNLIFFSFPAHLVNSASYSMLNFFITGLFGTTIFGFYSLTFRILGIPLMIISQNVSKIFFKSASDEWNESKNFIKTFKKSNKILVCASLLITIFLIVFGPFLFRVVFGSSWETAGEYVRILAPMFGIRMIVSTLTTSFIIAKRQKMELFFQSFFIVCSLAAYFICNIYQFSIEIFLIIISLSYSIVYLLMYAYIYDLSKGDR